MFTGSIKVYENTSLKPKDPSLIKGMVALIIVFDALATYVLVIGGGPVFSRDYYSIRPLLLPLCVVVAKKLL